MELGPLQPLIQPDLRGDQTHPAAAALAQHPKEKIPDVSTSKPDTHGAIQRNASTRGADKRSQTRSMPNNTHKKEKNHISPSGKNKKKTKPGMKRCS